MNAIVTPAIFDMYKQEVLAEPFLLISGVLQNLDGVRIGQSGTHSGTAGRGDG